MQKKGAELTNKIVVRKLSPETCQDYRVAIELCSEFKNQFRSLVELRV